MFKNSVAESIVQSVDFDRRAANQSYQNAQDYCVSEGFTGDLETGTFVLGEETSAAHGISTRSGGLMAMTRVYSPQDRARVLTIFEQASTRSSRFSFQATILRADGRQIPVLCTGETVVDGDGASGSIKGVFVFSKALRH